MKRTTGFSAACALFALVVTNLVIAGDKPAPSPSLRPSQGLSTSRPIISPTAGPVPAIRKTEKSDAIDAPISSQKIENRDNYYWAFSAAAQAIAAMIGFLLAGITLAFSMMDSQVERDPTLHEVTQGLKGKYHRWLTILAIDAGLAITTCLASTFLNPIEGTLRDATIWIAGVTGLTSIAGATFFVISVISPEKYSREAKAELRELGAINDDGPHPAPDHLYFTRFLSLERDIRDFLKERDLYVPSRGAPRMTYSFRQMIDALNQNEVIDRPLTDDLFEINKFRNLLFHGHVREVPSKAIERLDSVTERWRQVKAQKKS